MTPWTRKLVPAALALLFLAAPAGPAWGQAAPPPGDISPNVEYVATIPEMRTAIAINFIGETMFVSTTTGLFSFDVTNPAAPRLLGALPMYIWENEDMDVDPRRKLVFISRDPRGFTTPASGGTFFPYGAVHIIDASNPAALAQVGFFLVPAGHTSTCVNNCDFLWTGGPYANPQTQGQWTGRPIFATDVRNPQ
ncbi:MAG: beta-propeller domain-containing protein, partial [Actinomycetota bacterium]|nr:beta-propeller domain-containing protein [Actinomycetota bacterium]